MSDFEHILENLQKVRIMEEKIRLAREVDLHWPLWQHLMRLYAGTAKWGRYSVKARFHSDIIRQDELLYNVIEDKLKAEGCKHISLRSISFEERDNCVEQRTVVFKVVVGDESKRYT